MARRKIGSYLGDFAARRAGVGIGVLPVPIRVVEVREEDPEEHGNEERVYDDGNEGLRARDRAVVRVVARATLDALTSAVASGDFKVTKVLYCTKYLLYFYTRP